MAYSRFAKYWGYLFPVSCRQTRQLCWLWDASIPDCAKRHQENKLLLHSTASSLTLSGHNRDFSQLIFEVGSWVTPPVKSSFFIVMKMRPSARVSRCLFAALACPCRGGGRQSQSKLREADESCRWDWLGDEGQTPPSERASVLEALEASETGPSESWLASQLYGETADSFTMPSSTAPASGRIRWACFLKIMGENTLN